MDKRDEGGKEAEQQMEMELKQQHDRKHGSTEVT